MYSLLSKLDPGPIVISTGWTCPWPLSCTSAYGLPLDPRLLVVTLDIPADRALWVYIVAHTAAVKSELPLFAPSVEADGFVRKAGCLKRGEAFHLSFHCFFTQWPRTQEASAQQLGFMHDLVDHLWQDEKSQPKSPG
ncbi:hypothetical protein CTA1_3712 [Colletotrichum tanaceti]|uniref:Uncharacterized protein n=1 Tax=Colletotrichum tanaceti TaxID=1306861 RepID=A0A4V6DFW8_9PEZI|nr:hypothetical protein CTA1_3712 [Colletotrichum tanaceti]